MQMTDLHTLEESGLRPETCEDEEVSIVVLENHSEG